MKSKRFFLITVLIGILAMAFLFFGYSSILENIPPKSPDSQDMMGFFARPSYSPDGKKILFIYAKDVSDVWEIYSADSDGKNVVQLTDFNEARIKKGPLFSPDGKTIIFHADIDAGAQLFSMDPNGNHLTQLTDLPGYNVEPYWSYDGTEIIFNHIPPDGNVKIYVMNSDGTKVRQLVKSGKNDWYPRFLTSTEVLFTSDEDADNDHDIFTAQINDEKRNKLIDLPGINWFPELSPDGSKILFHSNHDDPELSDSGDYNIYKFDLKSKAVTPIIRLEGQELHAKWHPTKNKIIFERHTISGESLGLFIFDFDTNKIERLNLKS